MSTNFLDHLRSKGIRGTPSKGLNDYHKTIDISTGKSTLYCPYKERIVSHLEVLETYRVEVEDEDNISREEEMLASILLNMVLPHNPPLGLLAENLKAGIKELGHAKECLKMLKTKWNSL